MKILIDLDDTVWDLLSLWVFYLNKLHNLNVNVDDIKEWDMSKTFTTLTKEEIIEPLTFYSLWHNILPNDGAQKYIKELSIDNEIYFVTATDYRNIEYKVKLLQKYFDFIPIQNLIICHHKDMINGDILIDDNITNLKNRPRGILYTSPFNKRFNIDNYKNIIRIDNWKSIFKYVKELNEC